VIWDCDWNSTNISYKKICVLVRMLVLCPQLFEIFFGLQKNKVWSFIIKSIFLFLGNVSILDREYFFQKAFQIIPITFRHFLPHHHPGPPYWPRVILIFFKEAEKCMWHFGTPHRVSHIIWMASNNNLFFQARL